MGKLIIFSQIAAKNKTILPDRISEPVRIDEIWLGDLTIARPSAL
ncbi:MAG: hypothetical protein WAM78_16620 [Candidatus Sulfotelmatobacter sp.]